MHVGHEGAAIGETLHDILPEILGVRTREAESPKAGSGPHRIEEFRETAAVHRIAVRIDVLAEKLDLHEPIPSKIFGLARTAVDRSATLPSPSHRRYWSATIAAARSSPASTRTCALRRARLRAV